MGCVGRNPKSGKRKGGIKVHTVEFKAYYLESNFQKQIHHELSNFVFENGSWFYVNGEFLWF